MSYKETYSPHSELGLGIPIAILGFVANHRHPVKDGSRYDHLIPPSSGTYEIIKPNGTVKHTVEEMDKLTLATLKDTEKIAPLLYADELPDLCRNVWNFIHHHCQYKLDKAGVEELRRPKRLWRDAQILSRNPKTADQAGGDCDCMSIMAMSILLNIAKQFPKKYGNLNPKFRITDYGTGWQHVYVTVPLLENKKRYYVIDCVLPSFNEEKIFINKFDHNMSSTNLTGIPSGRLTGIGEAVYNNQDILDSVISGSHFDNADNTPLNGIGEVEGNSPMINAIYGQLITTRDYIINNPDSVALMGGAKNHIDMLNYAISRWNTPEREAALELLAKKENEWNKMEDHSVLKGSVNEMEIGFTPEEEAMFGLEGLGRFSLRGAGQNFFNNVKKAVKAVQKVNRKIVGKIAGHKAEEKLAARQDRMNDKMEHIHEKLKEKTEKFIAKAKEIAKKVGKFIKKFLILSNPLTLAMRAGFLFALKTNIGKMSERLYPGYFSEGEAAKMGINKAQWEASKRGVDKVGDLFEAIGGKLSKMERYVKKSKAAATYSQKQFMDQRREHMKNSHKLSGLGDIGLGEPSTAVTATCIITAAATIISALIKMAQSGISSKNYRALEEKKAEEKTAQAKIKASSNYHDKRTVTTEQYVDGLGDEGLPATPEQGATATMEDHGTTDTVAAQAGADNEPPPLTEGDEKKGGKGFKRFIEWVKAVFHRRKKKGEAQPDPNQTVKEESADSTTPTAAKQGFLKDTSKELITAAYKKATEAKEDALSKGKTAEEAEAASKEAFMQASESKEALQHIQAADASEGWGGKVWGYMKANPGITIAGILGASALISLCFPAVRRKLGISKPKLSKKPSLEGLGGIDGHKKKSKPKMMQTTTTTVVNKRVTLK